MGKYYGTQISRLLYQQDIKIQLLKCHKRIFQTKTRKPIASLICLTAWQWNFKNLRAGNLIWYFLLRQYLRLSTHLAPLSLLFYTVIRRDVTGQNIIHPDEGCLRSYITIFLPFYDFYHYLHYFMYKVLMKFNNL